MTHPALARALARLCPLATLYARTAAENARLRVKLARARDELAKAADERQALFAHLSLAASQRDIALALAREAAWNEADDGWMRSHGVQP